MPTIFIYLGITIKFYSNDHQPIHVHAIKNNNLLIIKLFVENNIITRTVYQPKTGKFTPHELAKLKQFINQNKYTILYAWQQFFDHKVKIKTITINGK